MAGYAFRNDFPSAEVMLMALTSFFRGIVAMGLLLALALLPACSNDDNGGSLTPPALELNSGTLAGAGVGVYSHTFNSAGAFPYHCTFHGFMRDTIHVDPSSANTSLAVSITGNAFVPAGSTVRTGGTVTWTNNDGTSTNHTVTSD